MNRTICIRSANDFGYIALIAVILRSMCEGLASSGYNPGRMPHNIGQGAVQTFERLEVSARLFGKLLITEICTSHFYYHQIVC
jgi:hypothetical protein